MKTPLLTTLISVPLLAMSLSMGAYANEAEHAGHAGHTDEAGKKMDMPMQEKMKAMRAKMQAEMQTIIDTEDTAKRKELFAAHKEKMKGMMGMMKKMHGGCGGMHGDKHAHKEGDSHDGDHEHKEGDKH
ncbi:MAG TPA: hypothetical protein ENJ33_04280 [Thiothrix sp.]|nr:hypothetical protein [Thiothrix sp.]